MTSHNELLEVGELTNLRWQRLQLVGRELKEKGRDEENITSVHCNEDLRMRIKSQSQIDSIT